jgi:hypothetical protein
MSLVVTSIKIIKRNQREPPAEQREEPAQTENQLRREMVKTVASWIVDRRKSINNALPLSPTTLTRL